MTESGSAAAAAETAAAGPAGPRLGFIGAGRVARALAGALAGAGFPVVAVASRSQESAAALGARLPGALVAPALQGVVDRAEVVFLTVPDDAIAPACAALAWRPGQLAVHCSGAHGLAPLEPVVRRGAMAGAMHPLWSLALETGSAPGPGLPAGVTFALEGTPGAVPALRRMVAALGGSALELPAGQRTAYHLGAVLASNYLVTLMHLAARLWEGALGVDESQALRALLPLVRGTLANLERLGPVRALTGPVARGDAGTVAAHLDELARRAPWLHPAYLELARQTVRLAAAAPGGPPLEAVRRALEMEAGPT